MGYCFDPPQVDAGFHLGRKRRGVECGVDRSQNMAGEEVHGLRALEGASLLLTIALKSPSPSQRDS